MAGQALARKPKAVQRMAQIIEHRPEPIPFINAVAQMVLPDVDARQAYLELDQVDARIDAVSSLLASAMISDGAQA
jgi:hypothetical protein